MAIAFMNRSRSGGQPQASNVRGLVKPATAKRSRIVSGASVAAAAPGTCVITARNLEIHSLIGRPYSGVSLDVAQGQVFAIRGRNGSGKTALLLTLAGRMIFNKGSLEILGYKMPLRMGKVHSRIALALFEGLNDLPHPQKVCDAVAAEFELHGRSPKRDAVAAYLHEWHLEDIANHTIGSLTREQLVALGVQLAWVGHPDIIVVDDIESGLTLGQSAQIMKRLHAMAQSRNVTILVGVLERELAAMADEAFYLGEDGQAQTPQGAGLQPYAQVDGNLGAKALHNKDQHAQAGNSEHDAQTGCGYQDAQDPLCSTDGEGR